MAAHIYTVLKQVIERPEAELPYLKHGLSYAQFGDNMDYQDWRRLNDALDNGGSDALDLCGYLRDIYELKWQQLGCPATAEEWTINWIAWAKKELAKGLSHE